MAAPSHDQQQPQQQQLDIKTILAESKRIINAHTRHFLALSVLFLLPLSFSLASYPTLLSLLSTTNNLPNNLLYLTHHKTPSLPNSPLESSPSRHVITLSLVLCSVFLVLFLLSTSSISYSTLHGFYGRPVKLAKALRSAFVSFFPLLFTVFLIQSSLLFVVLASGLLLFLVNKVFDVLGVRDFESFDLSSIYFNSFCGVILIACVVIVVYLQLNWVLVSAIVVVEKRWGLDSLRRSWFLVKEMRRTALSLMLFFGFIAAALIGASWGLGVFGFGIDGDYHGWKSWLFVVQIVAVSALLTLLFLYNVAANTVLYMYCKAERGELVWEIAEEFVGEYVSLPFDDGKVPHFVSVAYF